MPGLISLATEANYAELRQSSLRGKDGVGPIVNTSRGYPLIKSSGEKIATPYSFGALSNVTLFEIAVFFLAFSTGFNGLYIASESQILSLAMGVVDIAFDLLLFVIAITKMNKVRSVLLLSVVVVCSVFVSYHSGTFLFIKLLLLVVCATGEKAEGFLTALKLSFSLVLIAGILLDSIGLGSEAQFRRNGIAFGFSHPNQAALIAVALFAVMLVEGEVKEKRFRFKAGYILLFLYIALTGSRSSLLVFIIIYIASCCVMRHKTIVANKMLLLLSSLLPVVVFLFAVITPTMLYQSPVIQAMDSVFSWRIWLNWFALDTFDVTLFGQQANLSVAGVYNDLRNAGNITTTVDCTYVGGLLRYGLVGMVMWLGLYVSAIRFSWQKESFGIAIVLIIFSLYAFTESQFMDPFINFGIVAAFMVSRSTNQDDGRRYRHAVFSKALLDGSERTKD